MSLEIRTTWGLNMEFLESLEIETLLLLAHTETAFYPWRKNKEALETLERRQPKILNGEEEN